ncbi:MAG TPA: VWA domain-containing protein [Vicinamibacterales bacterium]|nr:VWA domain-containing protein [Vicinamibacterales bacterium]
MTRLVMYAALAAGVLSAQSGGQQAPVFRGIGDSVPVFVTVTDKDNRLVPGLTRDDFQVLDNGRAQPLTVFDNTPQPVRIVVLLDVSGSMQGNLPLLRAGCEQLFSRLLPGDLARVGTFGKEIVISPTFTADVAALRAALPSEIEPNAPTPLWRGMDDAMNTFSGTDGRRVVLVLSDGKDAPGFRKFGERFISQLEIVDRAQREEVMIYGIGLRSRGAPGSMPIGGDLRSMLVDDLPDPALGTTALETGGGYFEIRPRDDLGAAFARVVEELHSQYLMGFAPPARDGKRHRVEVKLPGKDLKPRARKNYVAPKN